MPSLLIWARVQLFLMNNIPLIIMAAGVSSRMKTSNVSTDLSEDQVYQSNSRAKGFIEINEKRDSASARSYFTVIQAVKDFPLQPIISGRYHDSFKKSAKLWEFKKRIMHVDLMGDCSFHLL